MTGRSLTICAALAFACAAPSIAQERFDSAEAAAQAVIDAADATTPRGCRPFSVHRRKEFSPRAIPRRIAPNRPNSRASRAPSTGSKFPP